MKLLLDTHIIIWAALRPQLIPPKIESLIRDPKNELAVGALRLIHRDPSDRILIAQAQTEKLVLLTEDADVRRYPNLRFDLDQLDSWRIFAVGVIPGMEAQRSFSIRKSCMDKARLDHNSCEMR